MDHHGSSQVAGFCAICCSSYAMLHSCPAIGALQLRFSFQFGPSKHIFILVENPRCPTPHHDGFPVVIDFRFKELFDVARPTLDYQSHWARARPVYLGICPPCCLGTLDQLLMLLISSCCLLLLMLPVLSFFIPLSCAARALSRTACWMALGCSPGVHRGGRGLLLFQPSSHRHKARQGLSGPGG